MRIHALQVFTMHQALNIIRRTIPSTMTLVLSLVLFYAAIATTVQAQPSDIMTPQWVWSPNHVPGEVPQTACYFRKTIHVPEFKKAVIKVAADDVYSAFVNGKPAGSGSDSKSMTEHDVTSLLKTGKNVIAFKVENRNGQTAGLACEIFIDTADDQARVYLTNPTWRTNLRVLPLWNTTSYRDGRWDAARNLGPFGRTDGPGGKTQELSPAKPMAERVTKVDAKPKPKPASGSQLPNLIRNSSNGLTRLSAEEQKARQEFAETATPEAILGEEKPVTPSVATTPTPALPNSPGISKSTEPAVDIEVEDSPEFAVRPGFQIQHVAGHDETDSLIAMTFNEFGQILASQEGGPLLMVYDSNDNGTPDKVRVCCERVTSCQGILAVSGRIYVIADGPSGGALYQLEDLDRNGDYEKVTALVQFVGRLGEHGPHGLALGPDGMIYISIGNHTRLSQPFAMTSPHHDFYEGENTLPRYEDPLGHAKGIRAPGGGVLRVDLEGRHAELVAGGIRNAYDLAFNRDGDLFMHDSDMESDLGTPWHRPTRLLQIAMGGEYGWRSGYSKWPDYWVDTLPPLYETGRGSPTGCVFYDHNNYPDKYRGALFSCDWSQGEINVFWPKRGNLGYKTTSESFLRGKPLNVTDIDVGPDGWLYFCTGGRGTRGSIFRVVAQNVQSQVPGPQARNPQGLRAAIKQPQLQSAWARQSISTLAHTMRQDWGRGIRQFVADRNNSPSERARALQLMHLVGPPPSDVELVQLSLDASEDVRNKCAYLLGLIGNDVSTARLIEMLRDKSGPVRRQACDSLARTGQQVPLKNLAPLLKSPNRFESWAARRVLELNYTDKWQDEILRTGDLRTFIQGATAMMIATPDRERGLAILRRFEQLTRQFLNDADFVDLLRLASITAERAKLEPADFDRLKPLLLREFPAGNIRINRELARLLTFAQSSEAIPAMLDYLDSPVPAEERIHVAIQMRFIKEGWSGKQRSRLLTFLESAGRAKGGKNLSRYIDRINEDIVKQVKVNELSDIFENGDLMPKATLNCLFSLPQENDQQNLETLKNLDQQIQRSRGPEFDKLRVGIVAVMARGGLPDAMAYLRKMYDEEPERRPAIAMALAQHPDGRNWDYLVRSIAILDGDPAREVLTKLKGVDYAPESAEHLRQVILCGLRLKEDGAELAADLLEHWIQSEPDGSGYGWEARMRAWQQWFEKTYPYNPLAELPVEKGNNRWTYDDLVTFLSSSEGSHGSAVRGANVFVKAQCASCHVHGDVGKNLGPDLTTVNRRFQLREIVEAIVYPSQVVSDQYRSHTIYTNDGKQFTGLLLTNDDQARRIVPSDGNEKVIPNDQIDEILPVNTSSMPEGLLNPLSLEEIADLFAFLLEKDAKSRPRMARQQ